MEYSLFDKSRLLTRAMTITNITDDLAECLKLCFGDDIRGEFISDFIVSAAGNLCAMVWKSDVKDHLGDIKCYHVKHIKVNNLLQMYNLLYTRSVQPSYFISYRDSFSGKNLRDYIVIIKFDRSQFTFKAFILTE